MSFLLHRYTCKRTRRFVGRSLGTYSLRVPYMRHFYDRLRAALLPLVQLKYMTIETKFKRTLVIPNNPSHSKKLHKKPRAQKSHEAPSI